MARTRDVSITITAWLYHPCRNLEKTSCWNIKVKEAVAFSMKPGPSRWTRGTSERIQVDISEKEGNKFEEPNRSIRGWRIDKERHCQGLPTVKLNQFVWVQACQVEGNLNQQLHCCTNQQKLAQLMVSEVFLGELWRHYETSSIQLWVISVPLTVQLTHSPHHLVSYQIFWWVSFTFL